MNLVMIDGAIRQDHRCFQNNAVIQYGYRDGTWRIEKGIEGTGHGTAVANILFSNASRPFTLINFCVFDDNLRTTTEKLISALEFIDRYVDTPVINLSLGTICDDARLYAICKKLFDKNVILVAGFDNNGTISFPAAYDFVLGVDTSFKCLHKRDFVYVEDSIVNIRAMGGNQRVAWKDPEYILSAGTSFAAAHVTHEIVNHCPEWRYPQILSYFKENAQYVYESNHHSQKVAAEEPLAISHAALLPFSKEMQSLLHFKDLLTFHIDGIYDVKYSGNIGLRFQTLNHAETWEIKSLELCDWEAIDTVILGHILDMNPVVQEHILHTVIPNCIKYRVNIFCLDYQIYKSYEEEFHRHHLSISTPYVHAARQNKFGKLYHIHRPVLSVLGTSSQQGKFTLQLLLRKMFMEKKYQIGQLGTEPTSLLFGMDACFPFGYNSPLKEENVDPYQYIELVNAMLHEIDQKEPDIILTGCQSNIAPILFNNLRNMTVDQMNFLMGVNPDAAILCVNPYDHFDYIHRSVKTIEGLSRAKVLAAALYPFTYENNWAIFKGKKQRLSDEQIVQTKKVLEEKIGLPVFVIGHESDTARLFDLCIGYFSN